jgi:hypothetical protein
MRYSGPEKAEIIKLVEQGTVRNLVCEVMMMGSEGASHGDREGLA